jgi:vancomycin resistance protein YoaR
MGEHVLPAAPVRSARRSFRWGLFLTSMMAAVLLVAVLAVVGFETAFADRIYPGVWVQYVPLGGLTRQQAEAALRQQIPYYRDGRIEFHYREQTWSLAPELLGAQLDTGRLVDQAFALGRSGSPVDDLQQQLMLLRYGYFLEPITTFDAEIAATALHDIARQIDVPMRNAALTLNGTSIHAIPSHIGLEVDVAAAVEAVRAQVMARTAEPIDLVVHETHPVLPDVAAAEADLRYILASPIILRLPSLPSARDGAEDGGKEWRIEPAQLAAMVQFFAEPAGDGTDRMIVRLDEAQLVQVVAPIGPEIYRVPANARVDWDAEKNQLVAVEPGQDGLSLDVAETMRRIKTQAPTADHVVPLAVKIEKPPVDSNNLAALGITELVVEGTTQFKGSPAGRVKNIEIAAAKFDGVIVPPGEVFSFNEYLGDVTTDQGYEEAYIIYNNRTTIGLGGGICQVSTTAFRAAFFGGYPIVERWAHGYRVGWYEPPVGLDATVYAPSVDLKFENDTDHYLLIKTLVDKQKSTLAFRFYGTKPDRQVTLEGPVVQNVTPPGPPIYEDDPNLPAGQTKQVDWAKEGADVTIYRIIKQGDQETREKFFSHYRAWQDVFRVGTKQAEAPATRSEG